MQHLKDSLGPIGTTGNQARIAEITNFVNGLANENVDLFTFEAVKYILIKKFQARIDSWDKLMIIPERLLGVMSVATNNMVMRLPHLQKLLIMKYCINSQETFGITFPFLSADEDLITYQNPVPENLYLHVIDLPVYQIDRYRQRAGNSIL